MKTAGCGTGTQALAAGCTPAQVAVCTQGREGVRTWGRVAALVRDPAAARAPDPVKVSTRPGGGLYTGPGGAANSGPPASPLRRNWPPILELLRYLRGRAPVSGRPCCRCVRARVDPERAVMEGSRGGSTRRTPSEPWLAGTALASGLPGAVLDGELRAELLLKPVDQSSSAQVKCLVPALWYPMRAIERLHVASPANEFDDQPVAEPQLRT